MRVLGSYFTGGYLIHNQLELYTERQGGNHEHGVRVKI